MDVFLGSMQFLEPLTRKNAGPTFSRSGPCTASRSESIRRASRKAHRQCILIFSRLPWISVPSDPRTSRSPLDSFTSTTTFGRVLDRPLRPEAPFLSRYSQEHPGCAANQLHTLASGDEEQYLPQVVAFVPLYHPRREGGRNHTHHSRRRGQGGADLETGRLVRQILTG